MSVGSRQPDPGFVGTYRLVRPMGGGPSGERWLGESADGRPVTVKRLAPGAVEAQEVVERLAVVAPLVAAVGGGVAGLRDCVEQDGSCFVVSDLVEGVSLRALEDEGALSAARACAVVVQVLEVLARLHGLGVVHGAVTPEHVVVDASGTARLVDVAQSAITGRRPVGVAPAPYLAPEVVGGGGVDERAELFSAGVLLYEALCGALPPRPGPTTAAGRLGGFPPALEPAELDLVVRRALSEDPRFRHQSAAAFAAELRDVAARSAPATPKPPSAGAEETAWVPEPETDGSVRPPTVEREVDDGAPVRRKKPRHRGRRPAVVGAALFSVAVLAGWQSGWPPSLFGGQEAGAVRPTPPGPIRSAAGWSVRTVPGRSSQSAAGTGAGVAGSDLTADSALLSCPSPSFCVFAGTVTPTTPAGIVVTYSSGTWSSTAVPTAGLDPPAASSPLAQLDAVSCPAPAWCVAVGTYLGDTGSRFGLIETLAAGGWTAQAAPGQSLAGSVHRVACAAVGACAAIGQLGSTATTWVLRTGRWSAAPVPTEGLTPPSASSYDPHLNDVACAPAGSCVAVGAYYDGAGAELGLIETLVAGAWHASAAPFPTGRSAEGGGFSLDAVACPTASCVATGSAYDSSGYLHAIAETVASGHWASSSVGLGGVGLDEGSPQWVYLTSLACLEPASCLATGWYFASSSSGEVHGLLAIASGGAWSARAIPAAGLDPPAAGLDVVPLAASCHSTRACVVVGTYFDASGDEHGFIDTLEGGIWTSASAPTSGLDPAPGTDTGMQLGAVSCPGATCFASGVYQDPSGTLYGVLERGPG